MMLEAMLNRRPAAAASDLRQSVVLLVQSGSPFACMVSRGLGLGQSVEV